MIKTLAIGILLIMCFSCNNNTNSENSSKEVKLITLDPGHFHAALVQKSMYDNVDSVVQVYAPGGADLQLHLDRIAAYNNRAENPTHWKEEIYTGSDFFEKMIEEKKGNAIVLSGNNELKSEYILKSLQNGFNVLADKPMAIDGKGFNDIKAAFDVAQQNNLVLYDIMTERFEITSILQRELMMLPAVFGDLQKGSPDDPAVVKESTHYLFKYVSGQVLTRPAWFFDVKKQGESISDVMTHLVDLAQWESFPEQAIDYKNEVSIDSARHWPTTLNKSQFKSVTGLDSFPSELKNNIDADTVLNVFFNGTINYRLRGVHIKTTALWNYQAPEGGDSYYALSRGTKANLVIRQGKEQNYEPTLYIEPIVTDSNYESTLTQNFQALQSKYPGIELKKSSNGWQLVIPDKYKEGHEQHFARVTENFLKYLQGEPMPAWEIPDMLAKYYITTTAVEMANQAK